MDGQQGKTLTLEERKKMKEKLALLKKEYNQTIRRLQRSQKAERVKIHVKKTIEEQNRFLSQNENEVSITGLLRSSVLASFKDSTPAASVSWQVSANGSDVDAHRRTAVTFNLEPEVFCIGDGIDLSYHPASNCDGQENKCSVEKVTERSQRSRLKLRRSTSALKRRDSDSVPLSCEVSSLSCTPYLQTCLSSHESELHTLASSVCDGSSTFTPQLGQQSSEDSVQGVRMHDMENLTSQKLSLNGNFPDRQMAINTVEGTELSIDLSTASLESTPSLFVSLTPDPHRNREEIEASPLILDQEEHQINGSDKELASYFCFSNKSAKGDGIGSPVCAGRQPFIQEEPILSQLQLISNCDPKANSSQQTTRTHTGDVTLAPNCVPSSVTTESPLNSCTLIDGLLFPVEYYVRMTRRMSSFQRKVDLDAVIQNQLGTNRKSSRSKVKNLVSDPDKVAIDSTNQKGLITNSEMLLVDGNKNYACSPRTVKTGVEANSQSASPSYVPMTQVGSISSRKRGRGKAPARSRRKSTEKQQIDVDQEVAAADANKMATLTEKSLKTDYKSKKGHICKSTELSPQRCTLATSNARHQESLPSTYNSNTDNTWVMRPIERTRPQRNFSSLHTESPADDLTDFEMDLNVHRTPKRSAECNLNRTRTPRTPLIATQLLTSVNRDPQHNTPQSRQHRNKGKAVNDLKNYLLQESSEVADKPASMVWTPQVWSSHFNSPDERFSLNRLPHILNIQDFHLPDEEFGFLKLEKLKSCCAPPLEEFVCPVSKEESQTNQFLRESPASTCDFSNRLCLELLEKHVAEIEMQNQTLAIKPMITDAAASKEQDQTLAVKLMITDAAASKEQDQTLAVKPIITDAAASKEQDQTLAVKPIITDAAASKEQDQTLAIKPIITDAAASKEQDQTLAIKPIITDAAASKEQDQTLAIKPIITDDAASKEQDQNLAIKPIITDNAASKEQEQSITDEAFHQQKAIIEETGEPSYTEEAVNRETTVIEPECHSCSGTPLRVRNVSVSKVDKAAEDLNAEETLSINPEDKSCRSVGSVKELTTVQKNWDQQYAFGQGFAEDTVAKESCDQRIYSQDLIREHVAVQGVSQQPPTNQDPVIEQTSNGKKIHDQPNIEHEMQDDDLDRFVMSLDELTASQWLEPFPQVQPNGEPSSSHLLSTPLATVVPDTDFCNEVSLCTPALPILGLTPALSAPTHNSTSSTSWDIARGRPQTEAFCGPKVDVVLEHENDAFVCSLDDRDNVTRNTTSLVEGCAAVEPSSQKTNFRPKAMCETNALNMEMGPLQAKAELCNASELHSQMRDVKSKSESDQCETREPCFDKRPFVPDLRLYDSNESKNAAFSEQAWYEPTEICDHIREPASTYKTDCFKSAKKIDPFETPASAELCEWPAEMWHGRLQLLSQIQPSGSCSYAVDLSTVWWDIDGWRDMCTVIATEATVSLWKPLDAGKWDIAYTWSSPKGALPLKRFRQRLFTITSMQKLISQSIRGSNEISIISTDSTAIKDLHGCWTSFSQIPIMQLIPLPDDCNFVCVALGNLDIEEIWALSCSPDSSGLSALLVKHGHTLVVRGLTGRRLICSSGRHPDQMVEVLFLSEVGRSLDTRYMWPPGETLLSFAEVEGEENALVGTTAANNAVIWNSSSGQLLKKIPIENCLQPSHCLQAYSELGLLFLVLSHPHVHETENTKTSVLSLIAANPKEALSVHVMSYMLPTGCCGRYQEGDLKDHTVAVVLTTGTIVLWDLHLGHCTALLPENPHATWSLVRWCQVDSHLLTGQKDGSVSVYKYFESCEEKT